MKLDEKAISEIFRIIEKGKSAEVRLVRNEIVVTENDRKTKYRAAITV